MNSPKALLINLVLVAACAQAQQGTAAVEAPRRAGLISVQYSPTLNGVSAMLAVRACTGSANTSHAAHHPDDLAGAIAAPVVLVEREAQVPHDVVVRAVAPDGHEISHHEGVDDVWGYARSVAASLSSQEATQ